MASEEDITKYIFNNLRETPLLAKNYILQDGEYLPNRNCYINIKKYVDDFIDKKTDKKRRIERWLLLPGLRGTGKTTLVFQIYHYLISERRIKLENVLYLSADDVKNYLDTGIREVISQFIRNMHRTTLAELNEKTFVLIDEAHFDEKWEETVKVLYDRTVGNENLFIIVTGSSSLSLEMSTDSVRRKTKRSIFPLNFQEYLKLKYKFFPPSGTADLIRHVIFNGKDERFQRFIENENELHKRFLRFQKDIDLELEDFIYHGGFPFSLNMKPFLLYEKVSELVDRIICDDLSLIYPFKIQSRSGITKILMFLALKKTGSISQPKLANTTGIPLARVNQTLESLEKTHLIFSIKPYEGAAGTVRDAWRYYFLSPTIKASLLYKYGRLDRLDKIMFGELVENAVASSFFRMMKTINKPTGIFFYPGKGSSDFLLSYGDKIIPVEVSSGKKDKRQTSKNGRRIKKIKHKVIISNEENTKISGDTIFISLKTFLFS